MATTTSMSGAQFDSLPYEEGRKWELLEGALIEMPSVTPRHQTIVTVVLKPLVEYLGKSGLALPDSEFALSSRDRLRPDVCVLFAGKLQDIDLDVTPIPGASDIAIKVISPSERASDRFDKVRTYRRNGTSEVWRVYPRSKTVQTSLAVATLFS